MYEHPDAAQDKDLILSTLAPVFQLLESRIKSQEDRISELEQVVYKFIMGAYDATKSHKRAGLMDMISQNYGESIGPFKEIYGDMMSRDIVEDIVDLLDQEGIDGEGIGPFVSSFIEQAQNRFGKYLPKAGSVEVEVTTGPEAVEEMKESESEGASKDPIDSILQKIKSARESGK